VRRERHILELGSADSIRVPGNAWTVADESPGAATMGAGPGDVRDVAGPDGAGQVPSENAERPLRAQRRQQLIERG